MTKAQIHLCGDPILAGPVRRLGRLPAIKRDKNPFRSLCSTIVSQQLSTAAAATIWGRVAALAPEWSPAVVAALRTEQLRQAGCSRAKAGSVLDLADAVLSGAVSLAPQALKNDVDLRAQLVAIKGIGPWTVEMFQIFCLGRPDVFSVGDGGLRRAVCDLYDLDDTSYVQEIAAISSRWSPYRSLACRYLWKYLDMPVPGN